MDALFAELANIVYTGTRITFDTLAVDVRALLTTSTIVSYDSLTLIPITAPLNPGGFGALAMALDMYCAADLNIPQDELEITIWLQEEISVSG